MKPKVAVAMAVYRSDFLEEAILSLLGNTHKPIAICLCHAGSPEQAKIEEIAKKYECLITRRYAQKGVGFAKNKAVKLALSTKAKYIQLFDSDDIAYSGMIDTHLRSIEDYDRIHTSGENSGVPYVTSLDGLRQSNSYTSWAFGTAKLFKEHNFDPSLKHFDDWELWIRQAKAGAKVKAIQVKTCVYRLHPNSLSKDSNLDFNNQRELINKLND